MSEEYINKAIYVFDNTTGIGTYSIEWPWNPDEPARLTAEGANFSIQSKDFPDAYWMDVNSEEKTCLYREKIENINCSKIKAKADGVDEITITGLPEGSELLVNGIPYSTEDGTFTLSSTDALTATITLGGKHKSDYVLVDFLDVEGVKTIKWNELKEERQTRLATATTSFGVFDADAEAKTNINGIVTGIMVAQSMGMTPPDVSFRMKDNTTKIFAPNDFVQASLEISLYLENVYKRSWQLKEHLESLTEIEDIENLTWEAEIV